MTDDKKRPNESTDEAPGKPSGSSKPKKRKKKAAPAAPSPSARRATEARGTDKAAGRVVAAGPVSSAPDKGMPTGLIAIGVAAVAGLGYLAASRISGETKPGPDVVANAPASVAPASLSAPRSSLPVRPRPGADLPPAPADVAAPPADAKKEASGLVTKVITPGNGTDKPALNDVVSVHYTGWTTDGKGFDSSVKRGKPAEFPVRGVIKGWTEALQLMVVGEKRRLWIPSELAYGDKPQRPGAPAGPLTFDVELLDIKKAPPVPEDLAAPPADALTTKSGIRYRVLTKGTGSKHPSATDRVEVHYSGWTKDGAMFDSSSRRGAPAQFGLDQVIKGWTEGVQLMKEGDKVRFWIPADLAYGDTPRRPGAPSGELVFDIELLKILAAPGAPHGSTSAAASAPSAPASAPAAPRPAATAAPAAPRPTPAPATP